MFYFTYIFLSFYSLLIFLSFYISQMSQNPEYRGPVLNHQYVSPYLLHKPSVHPGTSKNKMAANGTNMAANGTSQMKLTAKKTNTDGMNVGKQTVIQD